MRQGMPAPAPGSHRLYLTIKRIASVEREELGALFWAFTFFFSLLCAYYIIRPIRDEMGIAGGVEQLQWMFSATFLATLATVPIFGWITRSFPVKKFLMYVYIFFIVNLLFFYGLFMSDLKHAYVARAFFIWVSVFNLFVVSVFWSLMADIFTSEQAKRLFSVIAAGGTTGALTGPVLTAALVRYVGTSNLLLFSAAFLMWSVICINRLIAWKRSQTSDDSRSASERPGDAESQRYGSPLGGGIFAGIQLVFRSSYLTGICFLMLFYTGLATFLYFHQARIVRDALANPTERTALFASMDFAVNAVTLGIQIFVSSRIIARLGIAWALALAPIILGAGLMLLWPSPLLLIVVIIQVLQRAGNYAVMRPAREMLFVVVGPEEKYKAKNFIDTVVYRGGDLVSAWIYAGLRAMGMAASGIALAAVPLVGGCAWLAVKLGRRHKILASSKGSTIEPAL